MRTLAAVATVTLALAGVLAYSLMGRAKSEETVQSVRPVRTQTIESGRTKEVSIYSGEVKARFETPMAFRVPGRIAKRQVDVGSVVRKGQLLATLDATDYDLSVRGLSAQVASVEADFNFQSAELARGTELLKKGFISQTDYDRRRNVYQEAKAKLEQARAALAQTQNQSDYTSLRALSDGVVTSVDAEAGQVVAAGQTVVQVARLQEKEVLIHVPENRLDELRSADSLRVELWAQPGKSYRGRVREISPSADPVTRTYLGRVSIADAGDAVHIGMTATVTVSRKADAHARHVPLTALVARDGKTFVWEVDATSHTVELTPVTVGAYSGDSVSIVDGLADGDIVVTAGVHKLFAHQKVTLLEQEPK